MYSTQINLSNLAGRQLHDEPAMVPESSSECIAVAQPGDDKSMAHRGKAYICEFRYNLSASHSWSWLLSEPLWAMQKNREVACPLAMGEMFSTKWAIAAPGRASKYFTLSTDNLRLASTEPVLSTLDKKETKLGVSSISTALLYHQP